MSTVSRGLVTLGLAALAGCGMSVPERAQTSSASVRLDMERFVGPYSAYEIRWRRHLTEEPMIQYKPQEFAAAATDGARVYIGSSASEFLALDRKNGDVVWRAPLGGAIHSRPSVVKTEGLIYVGAQDGGLYALELATGKTRWSYFARGPIESNPVYSAGVLYFTSGENRIYALDAARGTWKWQYDRESTESFTIRGYGSPLVVEDRVYVGFSDGMLACLNASTGAVLWTRPLFPENAHFVDVDATPLYHEGAIYVSGYAGGVYALEPKDGSVRWRYEVEGAGSVRAGKNGLCFTAAKLGIHCLDFAGHLKWRQSLGKGGELSPPTVVDPYVTVSSAAGGVYIADAERGTLYQYLYPGHGATGETVADQDQLYVLSNGGYFYAFGPPRGGKTVSPHN